MHAKLDSQINNAYKGIMHEFWILVPTLQWDNLQLTKNKYGLII
jgi:hypothetical protein